MKSIKEVTEIVESALCAKGFQGTVSVNPVSNTSGSTINYSFVKNATDE